MNSLIEEVRKKYKQKNLDIEGAAIEFMAEVKNACASDFENEEEMNTAIRRKFKIKLLSESMTDVERKVANKIVAICEGRG
ncbi:MAG: hypothetical protein AB2662_17340 [Candidatus Thiodiazotropha sp.]